MRTRARRGAWRFVAWLGAVGAALTLGAFGRTLAAGFVYDDAWTIVHNKHLAFPLHRLLWASWHGEARRMALPDATRPGMIASMWLDRHLFGLHPAGFHAHSVLLAAVSAALGGLVVFAVVRRRWPAALATAFFAVAPLHTEPVASINYREDLLSAAGCFAAMAILFWPGLLGAERSPRWRAGWSAGCAAAWGLALASKESSLFLVPLALAAWALRGKSLGWVRAREPALLALAGVGIVWFSWRSGLRFGADDVPTAIGLTTTQKLLGAARFETWAVASEVWPMTSVPERADLPPATWGDLAPFAAIVAVTVALSRRRSLRVPAFGATLALLAPLTSSPLVGPANERADRYLFAGVLGGALLWAWAFDELRKYVGRPAALGAAAVAVAACTVLSFGDCAVWHDDRALWTHAVDAAPGSARAWAALSRERRLEGDDTSALALAQHAVELVPTDPAARVTLAYTLIRLGRVDEATQELDYVTAIAPEWLGLAYGRECASLSAEKARLCVNATPD